MDSDERPECLLGDCTEAWWNDSFIAIWKEVANMIDNIVARGHEERRLGVEKVCSDLGELASFLPLLPISPPKGLQKDGRPIHPPSSLCTSQPAIGVSVVFIVIEIQGPTVETSKQSVTR